MPVVERARRQVRREGLPTVRLTAAETEQSTGAGVEIAKGEASRAMGGFGAVVANQAIGDYAAIQDQARDRADSIALLSAERQMAEWENKRLYDPETGALNRKGKDAMGLPEEISAEFAKVSGEIEKGLGNDRQRILFQRVKQQRGMGLDLNIRRHVANEMTHYEAEELDSSISNFMSSAVSNANDPKRVFEDLHRATDALKLHGPNLGMGPEQVEKRVKDIQSKTHAGVIERLLNQDNDKAAKAYYEEVKGAGQLNGDAIANIEKALEEGTLRGEAQRQSDAIVAKGGTLTEQRAAARAIEDPKLRDQVLQRIEHENAIKDKEEQDAEKEILIDAYNRVDKSGGNIAAIPTATWSKLSGNARSALRSYGEHLAKGVPINTDQTVYYGLIKKAMDDPDTFVSENLLNHRAKLDDSDFQQLASLQLSIKNGQKTQSNKQLDTFRTTSQLLNDSLALYGIDPNAKPNTDEGRAIAQLRRLVDMSVEQQSSLTGGKKVSNQDVQEYIDRLLIPTVAKKGSWWNILPGGEPFYDETKRLIDFTIADVPAEDRKQIEQALKRRQRTVTDQTILDTYITAQMRQRKQ